MLGGEIGSGRSPLIIGDQVDSALPPELDVLRAMPRDHGKAHRFEHGFEHAFLGRGELDEFEAVEAERIMVRLEMAIGHDNLTDSIIRYQ